MTMPNFDDFNNVWHVTVYGDDVTGDGSQLFPFASVKKAIESASDGDGVYIHEGTYRLEPMSPITSPNFGQAGIAHNKAIHIWGDSGNTILEWYGEDSEQRDGNVFQIEHSDSIVSNMVIHFHPYGSVNYSRSIFKRCEGRFENLFIENKSTSNTNWIYSYFNNNSGNPTIQNCIFKSNGMSQSDYSGSPVYTNCLFDVEPTEGTKNYCITRDIVESDWNFLLPSTPDLVDAGDPSILDPDGTVSDVGVKGGNYSWLALGESDFNCSITVSSRSNLSSNINVFSSQVEIPGAGGDVDLSYYDRVIYIDSINGDDELGSGEIENPVRTISKALELRREKTALVLEEGIHDSVNMNSNIYDNQEIHFIGRGNGTVFRFMGNFSGTSSGTNLRAKIKFIKLIWDGNNIGGTNLVPIGNDWEFHNVVFRNIPDVNFGYFIIHFYDSNTIFYNCIRVKQSTNFLRNTRAGSNLWLINCYGGFTSGFQTSQEMWDYRTNIITSVPNLSDEYNILDDGWKHTGTGENPDNTQSHIGVYGGEYAWGNPTIYGYQVNSGLVVPHRYSIESNINTFSHRVVVPGSAGDIDISNYDNVVYVDSLSGNDDTGTGEYTLPVRTINKAMSIVNNDSNEAIYMKKGFYYTERLGNMLDCYGVDFIGEGEDTIVELSYNSGLYNKSVKTNFFKFIIILSESFSTDDGRLISWNNSYTLDFNLYNMVIDVGNKITDVIIAPYVSNTGTLEVVSHRFYNTTTVSTRPTVWSRIQSTIVNPENIEIVNCATTHSTFHKETDGRPVPTSTTLYNVNVDDRYNIISDGWENTGTGENPDGSQAHIGVYGGEYAWGNPTIYGYQNRSRLYVKHRDDMLSSIEINPNGWMASRFAVWPVYIDDLNSYIEVKKISQIISSISIPPHNNMSGIFDVMPPPKINLTFEPSKDAFIRENVPKLNYGVDEQLAVGFESNGGELQSLIEFDISSIPPDQKLSLAELWIYYDQDSDPISNISIFNVTEGWEEYGVTWDGRPAIGDEITTFQVGESKGYIKIDIFPIVEKWYSGEIENHGIILKNLIEGDFRKFFASKERYGDYAPILNIEYYDPVIRSAGISEIPSNGIVRQTKSSDIESSLFVPSLWEYDDLASHIHIFNPDMIESFITVSRRDMFTEITVVQENEGFLLTEVSVRQADAADFNSSIVASKPIIYSTIDIRVADESDLYTILTIRRTEDEDFQSTISVNRDFISSEIEIVHASVIESFINVVREQTDDINSLIAVRRSEDNDIEGTVEVWHKSVLESEIWVRSGFLKSNIVIPYEGSSDLMSKLRTRIRYASDLPSEINLYYHDNLQSFIFIREVDEMSYQYVFII